MADRTQEREDAFVGYLSEVALQVGCVLSAVGYVVVLKNGVLQVVKLVEDGVKELGGVGDTPNHHDRHTRPRCGKDEGLIGAVDGVVGTVDFRLRATKLAEDWRELGEVGGEGIVVGEDAPVSVYVEIIA